jgi:segregation and condensation protein B
MELHHQIEAILFYQAEPITVKRLSELVKQSEEETRNALTTLGDALLSSGLRLLQNNNEVTLGTTPEASAIIEAITKEELNRELSKASLETLAIVLYKGPVTRAEIDYVRGVNSTFILRNLLIRGLIEKVENPKDQRSYLYRSTLALLEYMGVANVSELPEYSETLAALDAFAQTKAEAKEIDEPTFAAGGEGEAKDGEEEGGSLSEAEIEADIEEGVEADVLEEDEAGKNYDDTELRAHHDGQ